MAFEPPRPVHLQWEIQLAKKHEREEDELTKLQKQVRELKGIVRALQKRLRKVDKEHQAALAELEHEIAVEEDIEPAEKYDCSPERKCSCGKGELIRFEAAGRTFDRCTVCKFRIKLSG